MADLVVSVSADEFDSAHEFVKGVLVERSPDVDISTGSPLEGLMTENEAHLAALEQARMDALSQSFSLKAIVDNIVTVDDDHVDSLLSNYFITRTDATNATGPVKIVTDTPVPYQIPVGFELTFNALTFVTESAFRIYPADSSGVTDSATSRRMVTRSDGKFEFTITVVAVETGSSSKLLAGTALLITDPLAGMQTASVVADFTGGENRETNAELLARVSLGVTAKVLAGPEHIQATLANQFPGTTVAVIGVGSSLMTRDRDNLFGLSMGSKQDLYCRTTGYPATKTLTIDGTVTSGSARQVMLNIPYEDGVGVYRVTAVRPAGRVALFGDQPYQYTVNTYIGTNFIPKIRTTQDAAFSANGVLTIQFIDTLTTTPALTTDQIISYDVDVLYMPSIEAINTYVTDNDVRTGDMMVKAGVPCTLTVSATIRIPTTAQSPVAATVKQAISDAISALPFGTPSLSAFVIHRAISTLVTQGDVVNTHMRGTILSPAYEDIALETSAELIIPDRADLGVGAANTFFACSPDQVELTIVSR